MYIKTISTIMEVVRAAVLNNYGRCRNGVLFFLFSMLRCYNDRYIDTNTNLIPTLISWLDLMRFLSVDCDLEHSASKTEQQDFLCVWLLSAVHNSHRRCCLSQQRSGDEEKRYKKKSR